MDVGDPRFEIERVYQAAVNLWQERQPGSDPDWAPGEHNIGDAVESIPDTAIADRAKVDLASVRAILRGANGEGFVTDEREDGVWLKAVDPNP
jgi:hypothetical protein